MVHYIKVINFKVACVHTESFYQYLLFIFK